MLHFFPHYTADASNTPYAAELGRLGVAHRFFPAALTLRYQTRLGLLGRVYPRLVWLAVRSAVRSLLISRPRPTAVVITTDIEALVFGVLRKLLRLPTTIVFETFIVTPRRGSRANALYLRYFALIVSLIDLAVCHSSVEVPRYAGAFPRARCRFVCIPFGTTVTGREALRAASASRANGEAVIVAAGRSGRDYRTLAKAIQGLPCKLHIICDVGLPELQDGQDGQITIIRNCFREAYFAALAQALFVVVPLAVDDISAGQMVLLQASALGKAVIITRTATTQQYATDGEDAVLVGMGDVAHMRTAIRTLLDDARLRETIAANAARRFERDYSTEAYVRKLVAVIGG